MQKTFPPQSVIAAERVPALPVASSGDNSADRTLQACRRQEEVGESGTGILRAMIKADLSACRSSRAKGALAMDLRL